MDRFLILRSHKFPVMPGEEDEIVNDRMYGKALGLYLQKALTERGYTALDLFTEDWGWLLQIDAGAFWSGICIYSNRDQEAPTEYALRCNTEPGRKWLWRRFRFLDTTAWVEQFHQDLLSILKADPDIELIGDSEIFPFA